MGCKHDRLRTVGDRVFCCECGDELSIDFLMGVSGENRANNPAPEAKEDKPKARKRTAKKTV